MVISGPGLERRHFGPDCGGPLLVLATPGHGRPSCANVTAAPLWSSGRELHPKKSRSWPWSGPIEPKLVLTAQRVRTGSVYWAEWAQRGTSFGVTRAEPP
jgi:hypothetical protein